jgi:hypothetical protein
MRTSARAVGGPTGFGYDCGPVLWISDSRRVSGLDRCTALTPYLACPTSAGPTTVWRIP